MKIFKYPFILISFAYFLSYSIMLLNNGLFWDDWGLMNQDPDDLILLLDQLGGTLWTPIFLLLNKFNMPVLSRVITFFSFWLASLCCYLGLKRLKSFNESEIFFVTLFVALLPVNSAREILACTQYGIQYLLFSISLYLCVLWFDRGGAILRLLSLLFLALAAYVPSASGVFYVAFVFLLLKYNGKNWKDISAVDAMVLGFKHLDFFVVPVLVFMLKSLFFKPYGIYEGYNGFSLIFLLSAPYSLIVGVDQSLFEPFISFFKFKLSYSLLFILTSISYYVVIEKFQKPQFSLPKLVFGLLLLVVSILPYVVVGKIPYFASLSSRHQLFVSLGVAFILVYLLAKIIKNVKLLCFVYCLLASMCVIENMYFCTIYQRDWLKKDAIMCCLKEMKDLEHMHTVLVEDKLQCFYENHHYLYYEWNGIFKEVTGVADRLAVDTHSDFFLAEHKTYMPYGNYNMKDYIYSLPDTYLIVDQGKTEFTFCRVVQLMGLRLIMPGEYWKSIKDYASVTCVPVTEKIDDTVPIKLLRFGK